MMGYHIAIQNYFQEIFEDVGNTHDIEISLKVGHKAGYMLYM